MIPSVLGVREGWYRMYGYVDINVTKVIDFPNVVSVWVTLFEVDEVVGGGGGGGLLAGHHAELEAVLRCLRAEVARHGHARRHVAHRPRLLVRAQADQVPIRLLTQNIFYRNRNTKYFSKISFFLNIFLFFYKIFRNTKYFYRNRNTFDVLLIHRESVPLRINIEV